MTWLRSFRRKKIDESAMGPLFPQVREAIREVQAYARSHGGEIELLEVNTEGDVRVKFRGTCSHCPLSTVTLKHGVEERLQQLVPGVRRVIQA